jgi:hypothetical protein
MEVAGKRRTLWMAACSSGLKDAVAADDDEDNEVEGDDDDEDNEVEGDATSESSLRTRSKNAAAADVDMQTLLRTNACTNASTGTRRVSARSLSSSCPEANMTRLVGNGGRRAAAAATGGGWSPERRSARRVSKSL